MSDAIIDFIFPECLLVKSECIEYKEGSIEKNLLGFISQAIFLFFQYRNAEDKMPKEVTVRTLIARWNTYRSKIAEPNRYCQISQDLYQVRNPGFNGSPPLTHWPPSLVDPDDEIMASVEHYFLTRCWVGTGRYPAWEVRMLRDIYDKGKSWGVTPRHNPSRPVTPPSEMQRKFQDEGIRDGEKDLAKSGKTAPKITTPPKYY